MKESDLAKRIIKHLEELGYVSYKEVCMKGRGGNARCDAYFVKKEGDKIIETIAIETKLNMNLTVIEQANRWLKYANKNYICVPSAKRKNWKARSFAYKVCEKFGIGVYEVSPHEIKEKVKAVNTPKYTLPPLYEEQRDFVAGTDDSKYYTSFKHTVKQLDDFMLDKDKYKWSDLIKEIKHHYKNDKNANTTLKKFIGGNVISGYHLKKEGRDLYLYKGTYFGK
jgi:hypothetical protein